MIDQLATLTPAHIQVAQELAKKHQILYWIRMDHMVPLETSLFPDTIFHEYQDALKAIHPRGIDTSGFMPWSRDEIVAFSHWEVEILSMMDKWYPDWTITQRKELYYEMLRYWGGLLDSLKPDAIVFNATPHQIFNLVLYAIARHRGIKTILFDTTFRMDRITEFADYKVGNEIIAKTMSQQSGSTVTFEDLKPYAQEYYRKVSSAPDPSPPYVADFMRIHSGWPRLRRRLAAYWPHIKDGSIMRRAFSRISKMVAADQIDIYKRLQRPVDFNSPYVYAPLHFQPECTTSPQGGVYVDQLLAIKTLAAALPKGWKLYVKEHPGQWIINGGDFTAFRHKGFYEEIASLPHVHLVPMETSTFELGDNAQTTATVTGTAAWESVVRGKCALIFGYCWFMHAPGIIRVSSVEDCRKAFADIAAGLTPSEADLFRFFKVLDEVSLPVHLYGDVQGMTDDWKAMHRAIEEALSA